MAVHPHPSPAALPPAVERSSLSARVREALPRGGTLPDEQWQRRHRFLVGLLVAHVVAVPAFGLAQGFAAWRCLLCAALLAALAALGVAGRHRRALAATAVALGLLSASGAVVWFWNGTTEAYFHVFVVIVLLTLYEEWAPLIAAAVAVVVHQVLLGNLSPGAVFEDGHHGKWGAIHIGFVAAAGAAAITAWRLNEGARSGSEQERERTRAAERALAQSSEALARYAGELERSNADLEQFAYVASHDLSEPLRTVASFVRLLQQRYAGRLDRDADEFINYAVGGTARMQRLIDDLLSYSRIGRARPEVGDVDLNEVVDEVLAALRASVETRHAKVDVRELPTLYGDRRELSQALQNIVSNALKFTQPDEPPQVEIDAARNDGGWEIRVADHGIGIDPATHERIFKMFQRLHGRDSYEGTGIGLAIVQRIAERHGGAVRVDATPGGGSTFVMTVPDRAGIVGRS